ncbi:MAG: O-antigen ligase family protein [Candidatus Moraniibacteriota bacterium]
MFDIKQKNQIQPETISAIFSIVFLSLFILANFFVGFVLPLYLLAVAIAFALAVMHPRSGLLTLIFLTLIFERFFTLSPLVLGKVEYKLFLPDIIMLGILLGLLFARLGKHKNTTKKFQLADGLLLGFMILNIIYYFLSVYLFGSDAYLSFSSLKNYVFYGLLYFITYLTINSREQLDRLLKFYFSGAVLILGFVLFGILNGEGLWTQFTPLSTEGVRILAFPHGLYLSLVFIPVLLFAIFRKKNWLIIFSLAFAVGIVGTMMRHLWVALALAIALIYIFLKREQKINARNIFLKTIFPLIGASILFFYLALLLPQSKLNDSFSGVSKALSQRSISIANAGDDESFIWRTIVWRSAWEKYRNNLILGIGTGQTVSVENGKYHDFIEIRNMHNSFLTILVQFGILGIGLFLAFVLVHVKMLFREADFRQNFHKLAFFSILTICLVAFMFQPYLETNLLAMFFWINLGLIRYICEEEKI